MNKIPLAIAGMGKIARDQHVPAIAATGVFEVAAVASPGQQLAGVRSFNNIEEALSSVPQIQAVAICTPPQVRYDIARVALELGKHVLLEKPPAATLDEVAALVDLANSKRLALFATWHSREAYAVESAREWLATRKIRSVVVNWKEDVRVWHPGQTWIWRAGGLGVFDPGINAISIVTRLLPDALVLTQAELSFPANCEAPIAASLVLVAAQNVPVRMEFDCLQAGPQSWDIEMETDGGRLKLSHGGAVMQIDDRVIAAGPNREYERLYAQFATLVRERRGDVDVAPLRIVADALTHGRRVTVAPFID